MRRKIAIVSVLTMVLFASFAPGTALASRNNVLLPNDCQIDGYNSWLPIYNELFGKTHEDYGCEKMQTRMHFYDYNNSEWVTHETIYWAGGSGRNVTITRYSNQAGAASYTDHNGRAGGTDWGFRLQPID